MDHPKTEAVAGARVPGLHHLPKLFPELFGCPGSHSAVSPSVLRCQPSCPRELCHSGTRTGQGTTQDPQGWAGARGASGPPPPVTPVPRFPRCGLWVRALQQGSDPLCHVPPRSTDSGGITQDLRGKVPPGAPWHQDPRPCWGSSPLLARGHGERGALETSHAEGCTAGVLLPPASCAPARAARSRLLLGAADGRRMMAKAPSSVGLGYKQR